MTPEPIRSAADVFTREPSAWVLETYGDPVDEPDSAPSTAPLQVANTVAFFDSIARAGFRLSVTRSSGGDTVIYVHANSAGYSLNFRRPNRGEVERAFAGPEPVRVGYPVRVLPDPTSPAQLYGPNGFQGATGIVMRRGADGWAGEGNAPAESWFVRLDSVPADARRRLARDNIARFPGHCLEVIGEVSQNNADPYPCAQCHGRGRTQLAPLDPCIRCSGTGSDPHVNKGLSDRATRELIANQLERGEVEHAPVIHDLDGTDSGAHAADCSGCEVEPVNTITGDESARFDVAIYFNDGREPERHADVSAARARELEQTFTASPAIEQIDVTQRGGEVETKTYTLDQAAAHPGGLSALTGGAITGPFFEVDDDDSDDEHEHYFPVLRVLEDGPVIGDCECGMTFDEYNDDQLSDLD